MAVNKKFNKTQKPVDSIERLSERDKPFSKLNFYMMGGCLILIVLGFLFMSGGSSTVEGGFNPDIFSTRRIVVGPLLSFLGFLLMAFAIIWNPEKSLKKERNSENQQA